MNNYPDTPFQAELARLRACHDARKWVGSMPFEEAWRACRRVDWMLWLLTHIRPDAQSARLCAALAAHWAAEATKAAEAAEVTEAARLCATLAARLCAKATKASDAAFRADDAARWVDAADACADLRNSIAFPVLI